MEEAEKSSGQAAQKKGNDKQATSLSLGVSSLSLSLTWSHRKREGVVGEGVSGGRALEAAKSETKEQRRVQSKMQVRKTESREIHDDRSRLLVEGAVCGCEGEQRKREGGRQRRPGVRSPAV